MHDRHISCLHAHKLSMSFKVVVGRKDASASQFLLQSGDVTQQILQLTTADVIHSIWWDRQTVRAVALRRSTLNHAVHSLYDIVEIGAVPLHVAIIEDLDLLTNSQFLRCGEVEQIWATGKAINSEETESC